MSSEQIIAILIASGVVAALGVLVGIFLGIAGKLLAVPTDERAEAIRECLPGSNCGGCGYSGCDALASAISKGDAPLDACPGCDQEAIDKIAAIMGQDSVASVRRVAFVKCSGGCQQTRFIYQYYGDHDCNRVAQVPGRGDKACAYGCTGLGTCVKACPFDAIHIVGGRAEVIYDKCRACGKCIAACPNHLIELVPATAGYAVRCFSQERGKVVKEMCDAGCIGCGICAKVCPTHAITLDNNIAHIDQTLCTGCGKCAEKCPAHVIISPFDANKNSAEAMQA